MSEEPSSIHFTIHGEPASKSNGRRWTGKFLIKSAKALSYTDAFRAQCPKLDNLMTGDLSVTIKIWYASRRPDLDASLIFDLMQGFIYDNDRAIKEHHLFWALDKENPRADITVRKLHAGSA